MKFKISVLIVILFLSLTSLGFAQQEVATLSGEGRSELHYWAVLLDASASFDERDRERSRALGIQNYRLRNEVAVLVDTLLGAQQLKNRNRSDCVYLYVFGGGVEEVDSMTEPCQGWPPNRTEKQYAGLIENAIRRAALTQRTDYFAALSHVTRVFQALPPPIDQDTFYHVVLISDGELDVGKNNRLPGTRPGPEELDVYNQYLRLDVEPMRWLAEHNVSLHTLAIDEKHRYDGKERQRELAQALDRYRTFGPSYLDAAAALARDFSNRAKAGEQLQESEGPYVMKAMADALGGYSTSSSVAYDNMPSVLWETIFSDNNAKRTGIMKGTRGLIVFAPRNTPLPIHRTEGRKVTLNWDEQSNSRDVRGDASDLALDQFVSSQYITWYINGPDLVGFADLLEGGLQFSQINNVELVWVEPEKQVGVLNEPLQLLLELRWRDEEGMPEKDEWRRILDQNPVKARMDIVNPAGDPFPDNDPISANIESVKDGSSTLLRIRYRLLSNEKAGPYSVEVSLFVGDVEKVAPLRAQPLTIDMIESAPLQMFDLFIRGWLDAEPGRPIQVPRPKAETTPGVVTARATTEPVRVSFEWLAEEGKECEGIELIRMDLPDLGRTLRSETNLVSTEQSEWQGDRRICFRSAALEVPEALIGKPLKIEVTDDRLPWEARWQVLAKISPKQIIFWALVAAVLLVLFLLLWFFRRKVAALMHQARLAVLARFADLPLRVSWKGGSLAWAKGQPKRFLVSPTIDGLSCELTRRRPGHQTCVEIRPQAKNFYLIRPVSGGLPEIRVKKDGESPGSWAPLASTGQVISILDLIDRKRFEIRFSESEDHIVTVGHRDL